MRALAVVRGKEYATVDMVKEVAVAALAHRVESRDPSKPASAIIESIVAGVDADPSIKSILRRA